DLVELAGEFGGFGFDFGVAKLGGVFLEVGGELRVEVIAKPGAVFSEKVQRFMAIAEPPFAIRRLEDEAVGFGEIEGGGVGRVFARREREREEMFGAIDDERGDAGRGVAVCVLR